MDNIRNYLTPCGAPPWIFKGDSQPYVTPMTKGSLALGNSSGGSWEKKFENMRGRKSIGFELGADVVENLVFPQAVEEKFVQLGVSDWAEAREGQRPMEANLVGKVILFYSPPPSLISYIMCDMHNISYIYGILVCII